MFTLLAVRHAKSSWKNPKLQNGERPLNQRGKRDAPFMGKLLARRGIAPDLILASPAVRAYDTARLLAREVACPETNIVRNRMLYLSTWETLLGVVRATDTACRTLLLVCHDPEITGLVNFLSGSQLEKLPTCSIVCLDFTVGAWQNVDRGNGHMRFFEYPKKYFH